MIKLSANYVAYQRTIVFRCLTWLIGAGIFVNSGTLANIVPMNKK